MNFCDVFLPPYVRYAMLISPLLFLMFFHNKAISIWKLLPNTTRRLGVYKQCAYPLTSLYPVTQNAVPTMLVMSQQVIQYVRTSLDLQQYPRAMFLYTMLQWFPVRSDNVHSFTKKKTVGSENKAWFNGRDTSALMQCHPR